MSSNQQTKEAYTLNHTFSNLYYNHLYFGFTNMTKFSSQVQKFTENLEKLKINCFRTGNIDEYPTTVLLRDHVANAHNFNLSNEFAR